MTDVGTTAGPPPVLRWEWRTFDDVDHVGPLLASEPGLAEPGLSESVSEETYVLSMYGDASVKVRDAVVDVKVLRRVEGSGLQLWMPIVKAPFPVGADVVVTAAEALGVGVADPPGRRWSHEELIAELVDPHPDLLAVEVRKRRRRGLLDGCLVELTDLTFGDRVHRTVAVESAERSLVTETVGRLGLAGRRNVCVARGLKVAGGWAPRRYAVLDVGTNSVKFNQGVRDPSGAPSVEVDTAVVTRLGEGLAEAGELTAAAVDRTVDAIARLVADARADGPIDVVAVGTAGLRQAPNRDVFLDAVLARCGVAVEVISGPEEARLAYRAAVGSLPITAERLLVFDSGGGSSQFTTGSRDRIDAQFSLDVGAARVAEAFGLTGAVSRENVDRALAAIAGELGRVADLPSPDAVVAIGGTSTNLAAVRLGLAAYDPDVVHGTVLDLAEVERQIDLYRMRSAAERQLITGLQPARAEVILAGACIVHTVLTLTGRDTMRVSDRGLRHGVLAESFGWSS